MSDPSMLQLKYKDYKEIIMQDLICEKMSLPKKPTPKPRKRKKHDLDQSALLAKDPPRRAKLYSLLEENFLKQVILYSAGAFLSCVQFWEYFKLLNGSSVT